MTQGVSFRPKIALVSLCLGAFNALLAMSVDTCTGGTADSPIGIVFSACLFAVAIGLCWKQRFTVVDCVLLTPVTVWLFWEAKFAAKLFLDTQFRGLSICSVMYDDPGYGDPAWDMQWVIHVWALTYLVVCLWLAWRWALVVWQQGRVRHGR